MSLPVFKARCKRSTAFWNSGKLSDIFSHLTAEQVEAVRHGPGGCIRSQKDVADILVNDPLCKNVFKLYLNEYRAIFMKD